MKITLTNINSNAKLDGQYQLDIIPRMCIAWNTYESEKYVYIYMAFLMYELEIKLR